MNISIEHNLSDAELRKALAGMAIGSGIENELLETLAKAIKVKACDDTPKEPRDPAVRHIYQMLRNEFAKAREDIERYAEALVSLRKSQLSFDFTAHHAAYDRIDPRTGKMEHIDAKGTQRHSVPEASPVVEQPQEAGMQKDIFYDKMTRTWVCTIRDAEGNQIGDCEYEPNKELALKTADRMLQEKMEEQSEPVTDLKEQLEAYKASLKARFIQNLEYELERFKQKYGPDMTGKDSNNRGVGSSKYYDRWLKLKGMSERDGNGEYHINHALADAPAQQYADLTIDAWHDKITHKLSDLQNTRVHRVDGDRFMISGERDGKKILIEQDMIINHSSNGLLFNQFPARIYVDGKFQSEEAYKKLIGTDKIEQAAKDAKAAEKRAKNMLPSGLFAKGDKVRLKLVRANGEKYETEGTVESEKDGKTMVKYGSNRFNMHGIRIDTEKLKRWNP